MAAGPRTGWLGSSSRALKPQSVIRGSSLSWREQALAAGRDRSRQKQERDGGMSTDETRRRLTRKLREELGEEICGALDHPQVIEIVLNDDGSLFVERLGEPMIKLCEGFDAKRAEAIIGTIASSLSTTCNRESPILSGEMPVLGARFQGLLPPIVTRQTFSIRKKASSVFPLEAY